MDAQPSRYPVPCRRDMLLSLGVRVFLNSWTLTVRCRCGRKQTAPLPSIAKVGLGELEARTLGDLVRRLRCQGCGQRPASVIAAHEPSREMEELVSGGEL